LSQDVKNSGAVSGAGFGLPEILNILYRGRRIVFYITLLGIIAGVAYGVFTKPLFRATAQIRPGIVSYSELGAPVREWALKDIVRWFRGNLFWDDMREESPFDEAAGPPVILAEFISSGPQYSRGGNVITLTNLSPDPLVAVKALKIAIASFNRQASQDSSSSTMQLTIGGAEVRKKKIIFAMDKVDGEMERTNLDIKNVQTELLKVDAAEKRIESEIERLKFSAEWRLQAVDKTLAEAESARGRRADAEVLLASLMDGKSVGSISESAGNTPVDEILLQSVQRNEAALAGELLSTVNELGAYIYNSTVRADSLQEAAAIVKSKIRKLELEKSVDLVQQRAVFQLKIDELEIRREIDLQSEKNDLKSDLEAVQLQLDMLSPLEQVGRVTVSQKPVRPRKMRALVILTALAFMGSIFVVFVWEFLRRNRKAILAENSGQ